MMEGGDTAEVKAGPLEAEAATDMSTNITGVDDGMMEMPLAQVGVAAHCNHGTVMLLCLVTSMFFALQMTPGSRVFHL